MIYIRNSYGIRIGRYESLEVAIKDARETLNDLCRTVLTIDDGKDSYSCNLVGEIKKNET